MPLHQTIAPPTECIIFPRECVCSAIAFVVTLLLYFALKDLCSWKCSLKSFATVLQLMNCCDKVIDFFGLFVFVYCPDPEEQETNGRKL